MNGFLNNRIWGLSLWIVLLTASLECYGATPKTTPDTLFFSLHFRQGDDLLMRQFRMNQQTLLEMDRVFATENHSRILKINIVGSASPEGALKHNKQLSLKRAEAVRNYLRWRWGIADSSVVEISKQADILSAWQQAIAQVSDMPKQREALKVVCSKGSIPTKWANIQQRYGLTARYMERRIFPYLRSAKIMVVLNPVELTNDPLNDTPSTGLVKAEKSIAPDTLNPANTRDTSIARGDVKMGNRTELTDSLAADDEATKRGSDAGSKAVRTDGIIKNKESYSFALKTNLLHGALAFAPNVGLEYALNRKSTIELTAALNHWGLNGSAASNKKLAHWIIQTEYRYWLNSSFNGHFFGAHLLGGKYNISEHNLPNLFAGRKLMESQYRYFGWTVGAGVSYGYFLPVGQHWGVEFTVGVGAAYLRYDKYDCVRCGRKIGTENNTYLGPTKAGISVVYKL